MSHKKTASLSLTLALCLAVAVFVTGCGGQASTSEPQGEQPAVEESAAATALADGTYEIEVDTDSSMFHADSCTLTVADGSYTATLVLPGEGFSRLYFGTAEEAASASDDDIYDYYLNDEGKYAFDIPVAALDEDLQIAAFGHRRDTWYDHTINFASPAEGAAAEAA